MHNEDNVYLTHEYQIYRLHRLMRRKLLDSEVNSYKIKDALYRALRSLLWFYKDADPSPTIGCEFELLPPEDGKKESSLKISIVTNSGNHIEIKNALLKDCIMNLLATRLINEKKVFFHWKVIEEFEKKKDESQEKRRQR